MTTDEPPSLISAIILSRLRDRSMGQVDEVQGLLDMMKGMEQIAGVMNETFMAIIKKKPSKSADHQKMIVVEGFSILISGLEKFVDGKTARITKLINYLELLHQDVKDERNQLSIFEKEWEPINRELNVFRVNFMNKPVGSSHPEDAIKDMDYISKDFMPRALPTAEKLTELENKMQKRHLSAIALLTTVNTSVNTNELYKLLT